MEGNEILDPVSLLKIATEMTNETLVFDEASGLHFDKEKDLYYDIVSETYYDYKDGSYYRFLNGEMVKIIAQRENIKEEPIKEEQIVEYDTDQSDDSVLENDKSENCESQDNFLEEIEKNKKQFCSQPIPYEQRPGDNSTLAGRASAIRAIVTKCRAYSGLNVGDLHLITIDGYTIGSDPTNDLKISDLSPFHCWITYVNTTGEFCLFSSETIGIISHPDVEEYYFETDEEINVRHGMSIELGFNIIELHLHQPGQLGQSETCDGCEPGLRKAEILRQSRLCAESKEVIHLRHKNELKQITGVVKPRKLSDESYRDRAKERREKFGVDNPYGHDAPASLNKEIPQNNKGRKMLEKSGWKPGEGLGKNKQGITEPIRENSARLNGDQTGIGKQSINKFKQKTIDRYYSSPH